MFLASLYNRLKRLNLINIDNVRGVYNKIDIDVSISIGTIFANKKRKLGEQR